MTARERQSEALHNALYGRSWSNYPAIIDGFMQKGIPESDIRPRENVFTYQAWKALGRQVRKGEHGVKVLTYVPMERKAEDRKEDGTVEEKTVTTRRPWTTTVFHVSQTDPIESRKAASS